MGNIRSGGVGSCVWGGGVCCLSLDPPSRLQAGVAVSPDRGCPSILLGRGLACPAAEAPRGGSETLGVREAGYGGTGQGLLSLQCCLHSSGPHGAPRDRTRA